MPTEDRPIQVIKASAGSGKTFRLSGRYIKLLLAGAEPDSILATTFTRKAAGEIQDRILKRLGEGALDEAKASRLSRELTGNESAYERKKFLEKTVAVANRLNRLRVCTLDAFFMQLASGYAFELGLPPSWTIVEDVENDAILSDAIRQTLAQTDGKNAYEIAKLLFKGKTSKSVENQVFDLVKDALELFHESNLDAWTGLKNELTPVDDDGVLAKLENAKLPNHKSIETARDNLLKALEADDWENVVKSGILQSVAKGKFSYYKKAIEGDLLDVLLQIKTLAANHVRQELAEQLESIWFVVASVAKYFDKEKMEKGAYRFDDLAAMLAKFVSPNAPGEAKKDEEDSATVSNDADRPGSTTSTKYRLGAETRSLLLDEFQDASVKQWRIIKPFAEQILENTKSRLDSPKTDSAFFCVGDVKQAIYAWRGGVSEIFDEVEKTIDDSVGNSSDFRESLDVSFRSCQTIIDVVNKLFYGDSPQKGKKALEVNKLFAELETAVPSDDPQKPVDVSLLTNAAVKKAVEEWSEGKKGKKENDKTEGFLKHDSDKKKVAGLSGFWALEVAPSCKLDDGEGTAKNQGVSLDAVVARDIRDYKTGNPFYEKNVFAEAVKDGKVQGLVAGDVSEDDDDETDGGKKQRNVTLAYAARRVWELNQTYPGATIGVLMRSNDQLGEFLRRLKKLGVEASDEGGAPLVDAPAVGAILALFRLAAHPEDSVDAFCVANVPALREWLEIKRNDALVVKLDPNRLVPETTRRIAAKLRGMIETKGFGRFVAEARDRIKSTCDDKRQRERMNQLVDFAYGFQAKSPNATLDAFVKAVESYKTQAPSEKKVRVMTIHGSKGLEFDIVVLPELDGNRQLSDVSREQFITGRKRSSDGDSSPLEPIEAVVKYVGAEERQLLPSKFQTYFQDATRQAVKEALCLLYVAVTRPRQALIAIVAPRIRPKKGVPKRNLSLANILRFGLTDVDFDEKNDERPWIDLGYPWVLYHEGSPEWRFVPKENKSTSEEEVLGKEKASETSNDQPNDFSRRKRRLFQRRSPTGSPEDFAEDVATTGFQRTAKKNRVLFGWKRPETYARGLCLHACFEHVEWLETPRTVPDENKLLPLAEFNREIARDALRRFEKALDTKFVAALLSRRVYENPEPQDDELFRVVPCAVAGASKLANPRFVVLRERPYQFINDKKVLWEGKIDRLVLLYDGSKLVAADVVDFKSDEKLVPERLDEYCVQLKRYGEAVQKLYKLPSDRVSLRVAFVTLGIIMDAKSGKTAIFDGTPAR